MNELIMRKMREGDWGAVVRLMREEREGAAEGGQPKAEPGRPMPFKERFETVRITPQKPSKSGFRAAAERRGDVVWRSIQPAAILS